MGLNPGPGLGSLAAVRALRALPYPVAEVRPIFGRTKLEQWSAGCYMWKTRQRAGCRFGKRIGSPRRGDAADPVEAAAW